MTPFREPPSQLTRAEFMARFGGIYEHNPWIAAAVFDAGQGGDTVEALADAMRGVVEAAGEDAQRTLLRAHPDLAGRLAQAGDLTAESTAEQASAGLDQCSPAEFEAFQRLNAAYTSRFGFPFIIAVRGLTRQAILERFGERLGNSPAAEFREALDQVHRIARLRLHEIARAGQAPGSAVKP
jgi:OHCU decarboxylase